MKSSKDKKSVDGSLSQESVSIKKVKKSKPHNSNDRICVRLFYCQALRLAKVNSANS